MVCVPEGVGARGWNVASAGRRVASDSCDKLPFGVQSSWTRLVITLAARAVVRPTLARDLLRVAWRFRVRGWYRRAPFLPVPSRTYVRWRMHTAYGDYDAVPPSEDVERYARWAGRAP